MAHGAQNHLYLPPLISVSRYRAKLAPLPPHPALKILYNLHSLSLNSVEI